MTQRRRLWWWAFGVAAAAGFLRLPSLNLPLDRDEGEYATLAWLWRSGAGVPYRDWLEQKPPLAVGMNLLAQAGWSDGVVGLRMVSWLWVVATVLALFLLVESLARAGRLGWRLKRQAPLRAQVAGLAALSAALLLSSSRTQSLAANTETWQTLPLIAAFGVLFRRDPARRGPGTYVLTGLCLGVASLFKQPVLAGILALPLASQEGDGTLLPAVGWTAAGAALAWAAAAAVFASSGSALAFLQCTVAYNQGYVLQGLAGSLEGLIPFLRAMLPELGAVACLAVLGWRTLGKDGGSRAWLAAWLALGAASLVSSGRYYPHYAILLLAPLAILAGVGLSGLLPESGVASTRRAPRFLRGLLAALALCTYAWFNGGLWTHPAPEDRTRHLYSLGTFAAAPQAARRIQELCPPDQKLFIWGDDAELYYLARRRPATRFLFTYPFTGEAPAWPGGDSEMVAGVLDADTGAAVVSKGLDTTQPLQRTLFETLQSQYVSDHSVHGFILGGRRR